MRLTADRLGLLQTFGFTENQARVYVALLEYPGLTAGGLGKAAQVPRNRLYEVLAELQGLGLVEVVLGRTRTYRANPLTVFLDHRVAELQETIRDIGARRDALALAFEPKETTEGSLDTGASRAVLGRRTVARTIDHMLESATTSVAIASSVGGFDRVLQHLNNAFGEDSGKVGVEIFLPSAIASTGGVDRFAPGLAKGVRWLRVPLGTLTVIVDAREMLVVHPVPDDNRLRVGNDFATLTTDEVLARDQLGLLRAASTSS